MALPFEKKAKYCKLPSGEIESRYVHSAEEEAELGPGWVDNPGYLDGRLPTPPTLRMNREGHGVTEAPMILIDKPLAVAQPAPKGGDQSKVIGIWELNALRGEEDEGTIQRIVDAQGRGERPTMADIPKFRDDDPWAGKKRKVK